MTTPQHEHEFEAAPGLPELLPEGEHIVWQAAPDWKQLAIHAFHVRKIAIYFSLMWLLQLAHYLDQGEATAYIVKQCGTSLLLAVVALGLLSISAYYAAQTALYTLTNRRVIMRIGIVLSLTFNVPLRRIVAADLGRMDSNCGDIALQLNSADRIAWLHLWPHARAWHVKQPQPTMRCLLDAEKLAHALAQAWQAENPHLAMRQVPRSTHNTSSSNEGVMA
jgi:Bacterial PH domain